MMKRVERKSSTVGEYMSTSEEGQRYSHWAKVYAGAVCGDSNISVRE
jgi:hypothetical protein